MMCRSTTSNGVSITESHPKALLWLLGKATPKHRPAEIALDELGEYVYVDENKIRGASEHERDAVLGAVAAFAMDSRLMGWQDLYPLESNTITPLDPPPAYWMPL
jgi:hypothetical protein